MLIYLTLIIFSAALIQNSHAVEEPALQPLQLQLPKSSLNVFEQELLNYIESYILGLDKYKKEIEEILSEILDKNKQPNVDHSFKAIKNSFALASANGNFCANKMLAKLAKEEDDVPCPTADDLVRLAGLIVTDTTDVITGAVHSVYVIFVDNKSCDDLSGFRCFLTKFRQAKEAIFKVTDTLITYRKKASHMIEVYKDYFNRCRTANVMKQIQYYSACNSLYKSKKM